MFADCLNSIVVIFLVARPLVPSLVGTVLKCRFYPCLGKLG